MLPFPDLKPALHTLFEGADRSVVWRLAATCGLAVAGGALTGLAPLALKEMIDAVETATAAGARSPLIAVAGAAYLLCLSAGRILAEIRPLLSSAAEQRLYARLRSRFFGHLLELPLSFHLGRRTGAIVQMLQQAISGYQILIYHLHASVLPLLVELATVMLVLVSLRQPALMASFAVTAVAYCAVLSSRTAALSNAAHEVSIANLETNALLADGLINYEPIKCFGAERAALDRFDRATRLLEGGWAGLQAQRLKIGLSGAAIYAASMASSLIIAGPAVADGALTVGGFVLANLYMLQIMRPLEMLSIAARDAAQSLALARPLLDILRMPPDTGEAQERTPVAEQANCEATGAVSGAAHLSFRNIHLSYEGGEPVLEDFCLDVPAGGSLAIVGASGSGKSSLGRLLMRLCEPQAGSILLNGMAIDCLPRVDLRAQIAIVPQDVVLFNATIASNIAIGKADATLEEITEAARVAGLHGFVSTLPQGYQTSIGERGLKLSGGERQRIAIARTVLRDPLIYVFDEATSMLDAETEAVILDRLKAVTAGRTTITIAHRLSVTQDADHIAVLRGGRIVEQGNHAALLALHGDYAAMWTAQQRATGA